MDGWCLHRVTVDGFTGSLLAFAGREALSLGFGIEEEGGSLCEKLKPRLMFSVLCRATPVNINLHFKFFEKATHIEYIGYTLLS